MENQKSQGFLEILNIENKCTGCGACASICPVDAITMNYNSEGFYYPQVDFSLCTDCKLCEKKCHVLNSSAEKKIPSFTSYMCWTKDAKLRKASSSGGMFSMLANAVLDEDGVVFGARYNYEKERLEHDHTDNYDLSEFRKSKYIESYIGRTFATVKQFLKDGRMVLFCGTPCQILGLKAYIGQMYKEKLLLVDFICHGVPSNKHFVEFKRHIEKKLKEKATKIDFRPKTKGWHYNNFIIKTKNKKCDILANTSIYHKSFYDNTLLRKSCYKCSYVNRHESDITIGDFWAVYCYKPEIDDNKGISLAIINSTKGAKFFDKLESLMVREEVPFSAVEYAYKKRDKERFNLNYRNVIAKEVIDKGYITTMKRLYSKKIRYYKIRKNLSRVKRFIIRKK